MSFKSDCDAIPELKDASKPGLQAMKPQDAAHVSKHAATVLTTSIDLDTALKASQPAASRWDYGVAQRLKGSETVHWIEVHPANGDHSIGQMHDKLAWLRAWLEGKSLAAYSREVVWVASGRSAFNARDPKLKALAQAGLRFAGGHYAI